LKKLLKKFKQLSSIEKVLTVTLFLCFLFTFSPWFLKENQLSVANQLKQYTETEKLNAYSGITAVVGYFYTIFILTALASQLLSLKSRFINSFFIKNYWFYLFLTGEALFLLIINGLIWAAYSMQSLKTEITYGFFITGIINIIALFAAHFYYLQKKKIRLKKMFVSQMQSNVHLEPDDLSVEKIKKPKTSQSTKVSQTEVPESQQMSLGDFVE
jgi:hypothetical protein